MKYNDDLQYEIIAPIVVGTAILILLIFTIMTTGKPTPSSKIEEKVPTQEELKKIDQDQDSLLLMQLLI